MSGLFEGYDQILIWGLGREGQAVLDVAHNENITDKVQIIDVKRPSVLPERVGYLSEDQLASTVSMFKTPLLVKSPGVSLYDPRLEQAIKNGASLTSQTNLYFKTKPDHQTVIAVTGTKGKSTTSALLYHMLTAQGVSAALAGNIGTPVLETPDEVSHVVLELSSYQIADLQHGPDGFIFLNMLSDHAPWHRGIVAYRRDKMRLIDLSSTALGVMNARDRILNDHYADRPNLNWFGTPTGFHEQDGMVYKGQTLWGNIESLPGSHNALNIAAALTMIEQLGFDTDLAFQSLNNFKGLPHRLQTVHRIGQVDFIDDALATTPESCVLALKALGDRDIALILGGENRNQDYDFLRDELDQIQTLKQIMTTPDNGDDIAKALSTGRHRAIVHKVQTLDQGVSQSFTALNGKGVVLLSPAAPRGRDFRDFAHRGAIFLECAKRLG